MDLHPLLAAPLTAASLLAQAEAGAEAAHGGGAIIPPTVWGILVFLTVLVILWKKAFPPISEALQKRERSIRDALEAAQRAKAEAEEMMRAHEASLEKARGEARAIIDEGKADAERVKASIVESARRDAQEMVERARREIDQAKRAAVDDLHRQSVALSLELAQKVIKKSLRPEDHQDLIRESLRRYQQARSA